MKHAPHSCLALVSLLLTAAPLAAAPLQQAQITRIHNDVQVTTGSGSARDARENETIRPSNSIRTGADSRAELVFSDKTLSRLGANTVFRFTGDSRNVELTKGTMLLQVPKNAGGARITTAAVTASVTGTTVMIEASSKRIKILVLEGSLKVTLKTPPHDSTVINAGEMLMFSPNAKSLPGALIFDLKKLLATSGLIKNGGRKKNLDMALINREIRLQSADIQNGGLQETSFGDGNVIIVGPNDSILKSRDRQRQAQPLPQPEVKPPPHMPPPRETPA